MQVLSSRSMGPQSQPSSEIHVLILLLMLLLLQVTVQLSGEGSEWTSWTGPRSISLQLSSESLCDSEKPKHRSLNTE